MGNVPYIFHCPCLFSGIMRWIFELGRVTRQGSSLENGKDGAAMRYKVFGKTGMKVSEMTLGTWGVGGVGWDDNPEEVRQDAIRASVEAGVNFIDTAPA